MAHRLAVAGCLGRMGQTIARVALEEKRFVLAAAFERPGATGVGEDYGTLLREPQPLGVLVGDDAAQALAAAEVCIDFTAPQATLEHVKLAAESNTRMVIGTTGFSDAQLKEIERVSKRVAIVLSPNMSLGVNLLFELAATAARQLGSDFDIEVVEAHHHHKKDAPSGTAKRLVEVIERARGLQAGSIPAHAVRAGDIVGDHTALFAGPAERIELTHRAHSREVFARGSLKAADFVLKQPVGLYDMRDVLKAMHAL